MNRYEIIGKYDYKIDNWARRISNTFETNAFHPGTGSGYAGYNVSAGNDTNVVAANCLNEMIDEIANDNSIPESEKESCIRYINDEILSRVKKNNVSSGKSAYRKTAASSILEDFVGLIILFLIIMGIVAIFQ